jgi:hypothetical protein
MKIEIDEQAVDLVVVASLKRHRKWIRPYYSDKLPVFSMDAKENKQMTQELKDAFDKVLEYYGVYK